MDLSTDELTLSAAIGRALPGLSVWAVQSEAVAILPELTELGWKLTPIEPLPDVAHARRHDPATSVQAAALIDDLSDRHWAVYCALQDMGEATDEELVKYYTERQPTRLVWPRQEPQSIRSRRAELVRAGHVEWTSLLRPTRTGRQAKVWQAR